MRHVNLSGVWTIFIFLIVNNSIAINISEGFKSAPSQLNDVNYTILNNVIHDSKNFSRLTSLIIVKDGYLLCENYYGKSKKETLQNVCSVSKTVIGLLIGMSVKKGNIHDVDDPLSAYLKTLPENWNEDKNKIQIKHLLSMTNGLTWNESDYDIVFETKEPLQYILSKPLQSKPSETFNYDMSAYTLSAIVSEVSGMSANDFARKNFFGKLGITRTNWDTLGSYTLGFSGLSIMPYDMAKIGQFMLQNGFTGADSLLPEQWMEHMSQNQAKNGIGASAEGIGDATEGGYGYMCWLAKKNSVRFFWAGGFGGQRIIVVPDKKLVVVMTASIDKPFWMPQTRYWKKSNDQDRNLLNFFTNRILPAFE
ncbi:MAG TPA: serine hydrolase [Chitinispirillaceae bacterium]|nr:serine hydrolase [Chitinispirillaceae bacterium]